MACLLALAVAPFPRAPLTNNVDSGWSAVLYAAHQHGWQFGTDLVFTYGPLGFLTVPYFFPDLFGWRLVADLATGLVWSAGLCLLLWRLRWTWRGPAIVLILLITANIEYGVQDLLLQLGLLCWGMLCLAEPRPRLHLLGLLWFVLFSALAKINGLVAGGLTLAAVALDLFCRGQRRSSLLLCVGAVLGFAGAWAALGQQLIHIPAYVGRGLALSAAYARTMALAPPWPWLIGGLVTLSVGLAAVIRRGMGDTEPRSPLCYSRLWFLPLSCKGRGPGRGGPLPDRAVSNSTSDENRQGDHHPSPRPLLRTAWLLTLVFISWKHGFVRADHHHVVLFFGFLAVLGLMLGAWPAATGPIPGQRDGTVWSIAACLIAILGFQVALYPGFLQANRLLEQVAANCGMLFRPAASRQPLEEAFNLQRRLTALPDFNAAVANAPVDVFGNAQARAVLQQWNYRPRPVFQSYAALSRPLMQLNTAFYASDLAPQFVLLELRPIDDRFPPLEDAWLLRDLLTRYAWVGTPGPGALLKTRRAPASRLNLLREGAVVPGTPIDLTHTNTTDLLWLEIDLEPSLLGRVRTFAYQPPELRLAVLDQSGVRTGQYRAPAPMLAAGFIASPLLLSREQLQAYYQGRAGDRPGGYSVELALGQRCLWEKHGRFRLYRIESRR